MFIRMALKRLAYFLCVLCFSSASSAFAEDVWSEPFQGVRYLHRTTTEPKTWDMHLVFIDLTAPGIRITSTQPGDRSMTNPRWAQKAGVQVAINGGMGGWDRAQTPRVQRPGGPTVADGVVWPDPFHEESEKNGAFAEGGGRLEFYRHNDIVKVEPWMHTLITGTAILVREGKAWDDWGDPERMNPRHPRTAIGATQDHKTLILLVVDGRQKHSVGMTGKDMQKVFLEFKAWDAINFDGGGSTCMTIEGLGVVNKPSDGQPRHNYNHLGFFAQPKPKEAKGSEEKPKEADGVRVKPEGGRADAGAVGDPKEAKGR